MKKSPSDPGIAQVFDAHAAVGLSPPQNSSCQELGTAKQGGMGFLKAESIEWEAVWTNERKTPSISLLLC